MLFPACAFPEIFLPILVADVVRLLEGTFNPLTSKPNA